MRIAPGSRFVLVLFLALLVFAAAGQGPLYAESNGSSGTPFPDDTVPTVDDTSSSTTESDELSTLELLYLYLMIL